MQNSSKQFILLKSEDNSCLIESAMRLHSKSYKSNMLFLSQKELSFVKSSIELLKDSMPEFDDVYSQTRFMFLKLPWADLDEMYGKTFFINEIQKMMKEEEFSTLYFHRADTFFVGCTRRDMERIISDIVEIARYYQKDVIFSLGEANRLGKIIDDVLYKEADVEYFIKRDATGVCQNNMTKCKKDESNIVLFSDKPEIVAFHKYIFKKDTNIHFNHISAVDENQSVLENADIIIFNLHNIPLKDNILLHIKKHNLKTKFIFLSRDKLIRKRDKVKKIEKGIFAIFEHNFDLLEYIYTIEKMIGHDFYTTVLNKVNVLPRNRYFRNEEVLKNSVYTLLNYHIYFSMVIVEYAENGAVTQEVIENCIRDLDSVYHSNENRHLIFLLVDIMPTNALDLIAHRLEDRDITVVSKEVFDVNSCSSMLGFSKKKQIDSVS
jgi:hypothetical protein